MFWHVRVLVSGMIWTLCNNSAAFQFRNMAFANNVTHGRSYMYISNISIDFLVHLSINFRS